MIFDLTELSLEERHNFYEYMHIEEPTKQVKNHDTGELEEVIDDMDGLRNPDDWHDSTDPTHIMGDMTPFSPHLLRTGHAPTGDPIYKRHAIGQWTEWEKQMPLNRGQIYKSVCRGHYEVPSRFDGDPDDTIDINAIQLLTNLRRPHYSTATPLSDAMHARYTMMRDNQAIAEWRHSNRVTYDPGATLDRMITTTFQHWETDEEEDFYAFDDEYRDEIGARWEKLELELRCLLGDEITERGHGPEGLHHAIEMMLSNFADYMLNSILLERTELEDWHDDEVVHIGINETMRYYNYERASQCRYKRKKVTTTDPITGVTTEQTVNILPPAEIFDMPCPQSETIDGEHRPLDPEQVAELILEHVPDSRIYNKDALFDYILAIYDFPEATQQDLADLMDFRDTKAIRTRKQSLLDGLTRHPAFTREHIEKHTTHMLEHELEYVQHLHQRSVKIANVL